MSLDNKISNILGTKLPQWLIKQLNTRSVQNSRNSRDNDNIIYLGNKTAWVRLVSSIDISDSDLTYFKTKVGDQTLKDGTDLAKKFILFGGTSIYQDNSYSLRSGLNGSYGMLGKDEISEYGYRPMPGITNVTIETQGRLGSIRAATINFKVWDKPQLDIIDALYFKLGYTMFLEWGHTFYYSSPQNPNSTTNIDLNKVNKTELLSINPFEQNLTKENILRKISKSSRETEGNYDAMLGMVTNFNFTYNQEGGYDCTLRLMSLGVLGDSIKINNPSILPNLLRDEILLLSKTLQESSLRNLETGEENLNTDPNDPKSTIFSIYGYLNRRETEFTAPAGSERWLLNKDGKFEPKDDVEYVNIITKYGIPNSLYPEPKELGVGAVTSFQLNNKDKYDFVYDDIEYSGETLYLQKFGLRIPEKNPENWVRNATLDKDRLAILVNKAYVEFINKNSIRTQNEYLIGLKNNKENPYLYTSDPIIYSVGSNEGSFVEFNTATQKNEIRYPNQKSFYLYITINIPEDLLSLGYKKGEKSGVIIDGKTFAVPPKKITLNQPAVNATAQTFSQVEAEAIPQRKEQISNEVYKNILFKLTTSGTDLNLTGTPKVSVSVSGNSSNRLIFSLSGVYNYKIETIVNGSNTADNSDTQVKETKNFPITWQISTTDTSLIKEINPALGLAKDQLFSDYYKTKKQKELEQQNQVEIETQEAQNLAKQELANQVLEALSFQSALEIMLRTIQVKALNNAFYKSSKGKPDLEIGRRVAPFEMPKNFIKQVFSNGIYSDIIETLVYNPEKISNSSYDSSDEQQFTVNAKYGFATSLLGNKADFTDLANKEVNYKELLKAYVVPYKIDTELIVGITTNHPVYIPLGLLLMLVNHTCTIYDTKKGVGKSFQKPLVYIDYNPNTNFMLTNPQQLSTNPWVTLIPYEGTFKDYKALFDNDVITGGNFIVPVSGSTQNTPLFNPQTQDLLSYQLPGIKDGIAYRGKVMNVLLNIDYVSNLVRDNSFKDGSNNVYLKPFLEQILSDINKYLGNFNALRLAYNDNANTFQIVDDQWIPSLSDEEQILSNPPNNNIENRTEIPLLGLSSIAKSLEIKTEISSKLSNMIAISSNSNPSEQAQLSTNGDSFGFINTNYTDRYIPRKLAASNTGSAVKNGEIIASTQFNQTISDFYSTISPSYTDVSQATSFFIEKMSKEKNNQPASRASMPIPVSVNLTTDGLSGMSMGQAFTVSDQLLPYNYTSNKPGSFFDGYINKVGFAIVGLTHTIEGNSWNTSIKAQMVAVKDKTLFNRAVETRNRNDAQFGETQTLTLSNNSIKFIDKNPWSAMFISYIMNKATNGAFPIDPYHSYYLNKIKSNPNGFLLLDPKYSEPILGDIIVYNRQGASNTYNQKLYDGPTHGDIVVQAADVIIGIGGNVGGTVKKTSYKLDKIRHIITPNVFMIVRPPEKFKNQIVISTIAEWEAWQRESLLETDILALPFLKKYYGLVGLKIPA